MSKLTAIAAGLAGTAALAPQDAEAGVITKGGKRILEAWHGSPHVFDKFDISKIGTGEGAQAYGHGLYFADAQDTAGEYRKKLTSGTFRSSDGSVFDASDVIKNPNVRTILEKTDGDIDAAIARARQSIDAVPGTQGAEYAAADLLTLEKMKESGGIARPTGAMYRTHIDVDPDSLLDWDKPLSEQPEAVQNAWGNHVAKYPTYADPSVVGGQYANPTGEQLYTALFEETPGMGMPAREQVTEALKAQGIPGIRYRDQMSRGNYTARTYYKGEPYSEPVSFSTEDNARQWMAEKEAEGFTTKLDDPSFNYVMFDDKPISIVERGNATPAMLGATAAAIATGMALNQDVQDAHNAVNHFAERRASKQDYWKQKRQEVLDMANSFTEGAFTALDMPLRGYMGLSGVAGTLAAGGGFDQALQEGGRIAAQPTDATAYGYGQTMTDTLSPYLPAPIAAGAGALTNAGVLLGSPL